MPKRWRKDYDASPLKSAFAGAREVLARIPAGVLYAALVLAGAKVALDSKVFSSGGPGVSGPSARSRVPAGFYAEQFVPEPGRLWLDVQIDRMEWWLKQQRIRSQKKD
mmetsp:Transcript_21432/g.63234  ORF Transcript_21432/g.63234 Transcript_21432/m.63234 type:complete len:108 (-) Transcript_21432:345-668(-)